MGGRHPSTWAITCCFLECSLTRWIGSRGAGTQPRYSAVGTGYPKWQLTTVPNASHISFNFSLLVALIYYILFSIFIIHLSTSVTALKILLIISTLVIAQSIHDDCFVFQNVFLSLWHLCNFLPKDRHVNVFQEVQILLVCSVGLFLKFESLDTEKVVSSSS